MIITPAGCGELEDIRERVVKSKCRGSRTFVASRLRGNRKCSHQQGDWETRSISTPRGPTTWKYPSKASWFSLSPQEKCLVLTHLTDHSFSSIIGRKNLLGPINVLETNGSCCFNSLKAGQFFERGQGSIPVPPTIRFAKGKTSYEFWVRSSELNL